MKDKIYTFLKGLLMGMADIVPGVSGGTIALITGIYEKLIFSINDIDVKIPIHIAKGNFSKASESIRKINFGFLVPLALGIFSAALVFSKIIKTMITFYPSVTFAFFFGLILASAFFVYKRTKIIDKKTIFMGFIGFLFAFLFTGMHTFYSVNSPIFTFFSGMIAICAMILPGISGAFILLFIGQYEYILGAVETLNIKILAVFGIGALIGLLSFVKLLNYLLKNHESGTLFFLTGLMIGSLRLPYTNIISIEFNLFYVILSGLISFFIVVIIEKISSRAIKK